MIWRGHGEEFYAQSLQRRRRRDGKRERRAVENAGGIKQRAVGTFINEGMGELTGQRLGHGEIRSVAIGDEERGFCSKKPGKAALEFAVEGMVAGGLA